METTEYEKEIIKYFEYEIKGNETTVAHKPTGVRATAQGRTIAHMKLVYHLLGVKFGPQLNNSLIEWPIIGVIDTRVL